MNVCDTVLLSLIGTLCHFLSTDFTTTQDILIAVVALIPATAFWIYFITLLILKVYRHINITRYTPQEVTRYGTV